MKEKPASDRLLELLLQGYSWNSAVAKLKAEQLSAGQGRVEVRV